MNADDWLTFPRVSGALMVLALIVLFGGIGLFLTRDNAVAGITTVTPRLIWERGLIMAAVILTALGLVLFGQTTGSSSGAALVQLGASGYFFAAVIIVTAEALHLAQGTAHYALIVTYVVVALLGQAALGAGLLQSGTVPAGFGWAAIAWNLFWLIVLPIFTPQDIYFPIVHHIVPAVLGLFLLRAP